MAAFPLTSPSAGHVFRPTDEELINFYLRNKINGNEDAVNGIREVDLCKEKPWDLPAMSLIKTNDDGWVFFCPCRKYGWGSRPNRATAEGYWKATGKDRLIEAVKGKTVIGVKKTLVFYTGRAPKGMRTNWVIHEYRATSKELDVTEPGQLFKKREKKLHRMQDENTERLILEELVRHPDPHREKDLSPTFKTLSTNSQITMVNDMCCQNLEPNELLPDNIFSSEYDKTEAAGGSFKYAFQLEGLTTQFTANPNLNTLVFPQSQIASTEVLSETMVSSKDWTSLTQILNEDMGSSEDSIASQPEPFLEGHVYESINLTEPTCSGPSPRQQRIPTTPYMMRRIPQMMPPLTSTQDTSSVTLKATHRYRIIKFQLPLTSGMIDLKEEVAKRLKLEHDSFDVKYKDEEGGWIVIRCDKDFRNYLQLFSSLVNRVISLLVVDKDPMGLNIVQLESLEQNPLVDFDATNNREYQSGILVSNSKNNDMKEASKIGCMTERIISLVDSTTRISSTDFDASENRAHLLRAHQGGPIVLTSEKKDTREGLRRECLTKCVLSSDDSTKQTLSLDFDAAENKAHLLRAYQSGPIVSVSENKNRGEALKRECLKDLQQLCGGRRDDATKRFGVIYEPGFPSTDYLACKTFKVLETFRHIDQERQRTQISQDISDAYGSHPIHVDTHIGQFQLQKSPNVPRLLQINSVEQGLTKPRYSGGLYAQSASSSRWPIGLPDGSHIVLLDPFEQSTQNIVHVAGAEECSPTVSLPEKKMVRTLKRKYRTISVIVENHQQHQSIALPDGEIVQLGSSVKQPLADFDATANWGFQSCVLSKRWCMTLISVSEFYSTDSLAWKSFEVLETLLPLEQPRNSADTDQQRQIRTQMCEEPSDACGSPQIHMDTQIGRFRTYLCPSLCPSICIRSIFWEEPNDFVPLLSPRRLTFKGCVRLEKSSYLPGLLQIDTVEQALTKSPKYSGGSTAQSASSSRGPIGSLDGGNVLLLDPLEQSTKNVAHAAKADLCSPTVSLPKKKMVRKSLKTKCRTMSLVFEDHRQHFGRRCEGAAKSLGATRICMKHGINRVSSVNRIHKPHGIHWWPFRQALFGSSQSYHLKKRWGRRNGYSLGGERTFKVSSLSMDDILDSRLLFIHMPQIARSSPLTSVTPEGGKIVGPIALLSSQLAARNNRAHHVRLDQSGSITSHYEWKNPREMLDRQGIAMSLCSIKDLQQHFGCKHKDAVKRLGVNIPMFKRTCRQPRIYWHPCWIKNNERKAFDATNNRAHLVEAEKETTREASKRECITKSVLISEELRQHYGGRRRDAANGLYDSLVRKSLEVLDVLPLWEESTTIEHLVPRRRLALQQRWIRPKKSLELPRSLQMNCPGGLTALSASSLHWPIGFPAGGHIVFLSKKIRKTFKRECRIICVTFEGHQQHFDSRCEGAANSPGGNHICEQDGISLVPKVKRICRQHWIHRSPFRQGNSLGGERPAEVIGVSTEEKLVSKLQFLHMPLLGRSSLCLLAFPSGSECVGRIGFSSNEFTATNNREHPGRQDRCGSSASRLQTERTREMLYREGIASHVLSFECHQQHFGSKRENDAKILGVRVSTFKRITRHRGIHRWPNQMRNSVWRSLDPIGEKNPSPMFKKLATNGQIMMENDMSGQNLEPNEFLPDSFEDLNFWNKENGSIGEMEKAPTFHDSFSCNCCDADVCFSSVYNKTEAAGVSFKLAFQLEDLTTKSTAYPYLNTPVFPQHQIASTEVLSENMGSTDYRGKLLASQAEDFLEGHVSESSNLTCPACSDAATPSHTMHAIPHMITPLTGGSSDTFPLECQSMQPTAYQYHNALGFPQPQIALPQIPIGNMGSLEDWRASQQEPFLEGHVSGSINSTVPTCLGPSPSQQPMPTTPDMMYRIPHMMPPLTSSQDTSSVKLKATYRDTIIEFQLALPSGIIELKEEVAMMLKLELDSFDMRYKYEEGEGDWILIPSDKDLRNYLQLFSSLVNPVIRLLVVDKDANLMNLDPMELKQPAMFMESGIDPDNNGIISDLLTFVSKKEIYRRAGKAWTRFYLLYRPPGDDKSSLIAAMANYLEFDICDLDLRSMSSIPELKNMLLSTPNRSLIAIQDIDHCAGMLPNLKNDLTVSCLLKYVDGLFTRFGDERIIVFTTNHRDRHDAALLPLVNMDICIPASFPQPIALPDGGEIVQLESSEQKPLMDFDPANNMEYHSGVLLSSSKNNNTREASKRRCMTESVLSLVDSTTGISSMDFDAPNNRAHLLRARQSGPIMSNSKKIDTGEGLNGHISTKSVLRLDDSTKRKSLPDFEDKEIKAHLLIAYQSDPVEPLEENKSRGEALVRECITKSILGLEELQQHYGGRRDDVAKSFGGKSFEVPETFRPREQQKKAIETDQEREIWTQMFLEQSNARGAHPIHVNMYTGRFQTHLFPSLFHSICVRNIFWEPPDDFVPLLSLRRLTFKGCVRKEKSPYLPRLLQINAVEPGLTISPKYSGGSFAKYASSSCGPIGLQDGEHIVLLDPLEQSTKNVAHVARADPCSLTASLPEKKMVRRTLKRKHRVISVMFKNHHQHFGRRFEGAAKSFRAMRICRKHGINRVSRVKHIHKQHGIQQWPFRQKWATRKGYSSGDGRLFEVSSLSMDEKLDPGLLFIKMSKFARSSPQTLALPDVGEIVAPIASSPSEFVGTNDRLHLVRQDQSGSTASHYERKNTRGTSERQGITMSSCSVEDLQQHFVCKHKDVVKRLDVSISMFKRTCRQHRGYWWPCQIENDDSLARMPFKECHESRFHKLNYLAWKLFKVLDVFRLWKQSDNIRHLVQRRKLALKRWVREKKSQDLSQTLQMNCSGSLTAQSASSLHWPISLPDGGRILSLLEKKTMKKTLKRKCSAMGVSFEDHRQHFCSRCECANRLGAKPIYEQHGINLLSTVKRIREQYGILRRTFRKGYSFGGQRPAGVLSLSTEVKLVSRLQFFHMSWLARSSRYPLALQSGSQISGHIAFSSSEFPATNNGAHPGRQDQRGSSASRPEKKRGRETKNGEGENNTISREDLEQNFGKKREEVANLFGVSVSTFKRICRKHGIPEWPNWRRNSGNSFPSIQRICREQRISPWPDWRSNRVFITPDGNGENNPPPTSNMLSTNGQITMEIELGGPNSEPNERLPNSFEDPNFQNIGNGSIAEFENPTTFHDSHQSHCHDADFHFSNVYNETEAAGGLGNFEGKVFESVSFMYPVYSDAAACSQHVPTVLQTMPQPQPLPEGHVFGSVNCTIGSISALALSQAMPTADTMESSEYWSDTLASVVGHRIEKSHCGSSNLIDPSCSNLAPSQPMQPTIPHMTPLLTERQDSRFMKLDATYGEDLIKLHLPLTFGIMELKQAVSKQLDLELDSFKVKYEDERGQWILITHEEEIREYLQRISSGNQVSNLLVVNKVPNTTHFCGNCECDKCRSLKGKRP